MKHGQNPLQSSLPSRQMIEGNSTLHAFTRPVLAVFLSVFLGATSAFAASQPGFELRMRDLSFESPLMKEALELSAGALGNWTQGQLKDGRIHFQIPSWGFEHNYFVLKNVRITLSASEWSLKKSSILELKCSRPNAVWNLGDLAFSPDRLKDLGYFINPDGTLSIEGNFEATLSGLLTPLFKEATLNKSFFFNANCPANASSVLQGFMRAWLVDYPSKNPDAFKKLSSAAEQALRSLSLEKIKLTDVVQKSLLALSQGSSSPQRVEFKLRRSFDPKVIRLIPKYGDVSSALEESLGTKARELLVAGAPQSGIEILGNSKLLESLVDVAIAQSSSVSKSKLSNTPFIEISSPLELDTLAAMVPELMPYHGKRVKLLARLLLEDCAAQSRVPRLIPFVGSDGNAYLDVAWVVNVEFLESNSKQVLAKRTLNPFWLRAQFQNLPGDRLGMMFKGGGLYSGEDLSNLPSKCSVQKGPPEFGLTMDWLLSSGSITKTVQNALDEALTSAPKEAKLRLRLLGQESEETRYLSEGYRAEAWVLQIQ